MHMHNVFGSKIYEIKEVLKDQKVEEFVHRTLTRVLRNIIISSKNHSNIAKACLKYAKVYASIFDYEDKAYEILEEGGFAGEFPETLVKRAEIMYKQIKPYIVKGSVLDLGCGDGRVGEMLSREHYVVLSDIYKDENIENIDLEFRLFKQGESVPFDDNEFDNALLLTVLHHSDDPIRTLRETHRVTKPGGRVLLIESVYGVKGRRLIVKNEILRNYSILTKEQQKRANIFFDHFHNRVIKFSEDLTAKVNLPFNFNTPEGWKRIFKRSGIHQEKIIHLGFDQPTVPEYHTLHVCRVKK
jgi:SAM-dependent methyltransferase